MEDEVNVFLACSVTPQNAKLDTPVPFCIFHEPSNMLITDFNEDDQISITNQI